MYKLDITIPEFRRYKIKTVLGLRLNTNELSCNYYFLYGFICQDHRENMVSISLTTKEKTIIT